MSDERRLAVLRAIVEDYVATQEPVGSKALVERHHLGVSPATIRNDMAALEEEGFIAQPHTSAGRIPTDQGYRLFVDRLAAGQAAQRRPSSAPSRPSSRVRSTSTTSSARTVRLLAQVTRQVAVVQYPSLTRSTVRHVELRRCSRPNRAHARGDHQHRPGRAADRRAARSRSTRTCWPTCAVQVNAAAVRAEARRGGRLGGRAAGHLRGGASARPCWPSSRPSSRRWWSESEERVVLGGTANLTRFGAGLPAHRAAGARGARGAGRAAAAARRGDRDRRADRADRPREPARGASSARPSSPSATAPRTRRCARLGILGPTRMDYPGTMGAVRAVARYVGRILAES